MIDTSGQNSIPNAILVLDIDHSITRAVLCDVVEGAARLVDVAETASTFAAPYFEMSVGISQAIRLLEDQTGRRLMENEAVITPSRPDGDGVDRLFVTGIPAEPNRIGMLTLDRGSLPQIIRTAVRRTVSVLADAGEYLEWTGERLAPSALEAWIRDARPTTVVLLAGGAPVDEWRGVLEVLAGAGPAYGVVQGIIIGDEERQHIAAEVLDDALELSGIDPGAYHESEIASAVEGELRDQYAARLPNETALQSFSSGMFVDRVQSIESVAAFLHRRMGRRLAVLSTQAGTLVEVASDQGALSVFRGDLDINQSAHSLLQLSGADIARWVPTQLTSDEVRHWLLNRSLRPQAQIFGSSDQAIAGGAIREAVLHISRQSGADETLDVDLVILGREFLDDLGPTALLVALDSLRTLPADGMVMLSVDRDGIMAALGALSAGEPDYAREVIENDFLAPLASCIVVHGSAQAGNRVADVEIVTDEGERQSFSLEFGEVRRVPLPEGRTAEVTVTPASNIAVGRYSAGDPVKFEGERRLHGGQLGLVFDARGKPSELPTDTETRIHTLNRWSDALNGNRSQTNL